MPDVTPKTSAVCFAFDLFGSGGTAAGAHLLADELREILADNRRESIPTRARAYTDRVRLREVDFSSLEDYADWRKQGRNLARQALRQGEFLLWLTGNHLGALPVYDELSAQGEGVRVVQFDAHLDIHRFRDSTPDLSHGNFLLHCAGPLPPLMNLGHRDLLLTRIDIRATFQQAIPSIQLVANLASAQEQVRAWTAGAERIYLDLDCDVFDPAYFPAVGQPVPFGLSPSLVPALIEAIPRDKLAGLIVSEFDPGRDQGDRSLAALVWLIEWVLLRRYESE